ncbi:MAG: TMEM175 family protein [Specibacter sp.]
MGSHRESRKNPASPRDPDKYSARIAAHEGRLRHGGEIERTVFFSDAVFAIAMTLLVLDLKLPALPANMTADRFDAILLEQRDPLAGFILSFVLVGRLWLAHHRRFNAIKSYDGKLQVINLFTLFFVVFLPVPTALLFEANSQTPWPPVIYAVTISGSYLGLNWLWRHAYRAGLMQPWVDAPMYRLVLRGQDPGWVVFVLSIPLAFIRPDFALFSWILIWPYSVISDKYRTRQFVKAETARLDAEARDGVID